MQEKDDNKVFLGNAIEPMCGEYTTAHVAMGVFLNEARRNFAFRVGRYAIIFTKDDSGNVFVEVRPIKEENQDGKK